MHMLVFSLIIINLVDTIIIILLFTKDMLVSGHNYSSWGTNVSGHCMYVHIHVGTIIQLTGYKLRKNPTEDLCSGNKLLVLFF